MNLWFRLFWLILSSWRRPRLTLPADASQIHFCVWPNDLDLSLHMNNGRYLTLMDLGRLDLLLRSGLLKAVVKNRWTPIASAILIRYRRELAPFQKFRLETRLLNWDSMLVIMEQTFVFDGGPREGQVAARGLFKGGIYDRRERAFVPVARLMELIGVKAQAPAAAPDVEAFMKADDSMKVATRSEK